MSMNTITPIGAGATGQVESSGAVKSHRSISDIILELGLIAMGHCEKKMEGFYETVEANNKKMAEMHELSTKDKLDAKEQARFKELTTKDYDQATFKEVLKTTSDGIGSVNTIDMTKLQSAINKMNEMTQLVSNNLSKFNSMNMAIIGNLR